MKFLLTTDGSRGAEEGVHFLATLPLTEDDTIALLTVIQEEEGREEAQKILQAATETLAGTKVPIRRHIRRGNAAVEILDSIVWMAEETPADVIVQGASGSSGLVRFFVGSVAERVARFAPCSVLTVRRPPQTTDSSLPVQRVLIGYDGSKGARHCLSFVQRLPLPSNIELVLMGVVTPAVGIGFLPPALLDSVRQLQREERQETGKALEDAAQELQKAGYAVQTVLEEGDAAGDILAAVRRLAVDLVVVGAQREDDAEQFLLGSVSQKLVQQAPCSVLIVRPRKRWS